MKHSINESYPDETHYKIAVMCDEEERALRAFLTLCKSIEVEEEKQQ